MHHLPQSLMVVVSSPSTPDGHRGLMILPTLAPLSIAEGLVSLNSVCDISNI
jgi:hypothetical protein